MLTSPCLTSIRYLSLLANLLVEKGVAVPDLLEGTGIKETDFNNLDLYLNLKQMEVLLNNATRLTGDQFLGVQLGQRLNLNTHGEIGYAGLAAKDAREGVQFAVRYFALSTSLISLQFHEDAKHISLVLEPAKGISRLVERFMTHTILSAFSVQMQFLLGGIPAGTYFDLADDADEIVDYLSGFDVTVHFNKPCNRLVLPRTILDTPFALADEQAKQLALKQCEERLKKLEKYKGFATQIYQILFQADKEMPSIEGISVKLNMSSRTLRRKLEKEDLSFREILNQAKVDKAIILMEKGKSISEAAYELGYDDPSNFARAFKRIKGLTPSAFLKSEK